jgi:hypothetical protein
MQDHPEWSGNAKNVFRLSGAMRAAGNAQRGMNPLAAKMAEQMPKSAKRTLTPEVASAILAEAGGDKNKARQLARERGYSF